MLLPILHFPQQYYIQYPQKNQLREFTVKNKIIIQ